MAPPNNERHSGHTGTIPKTKVRNNCNVPQEAVTPTRRDMASNLVSTSLDWVPVSEYNTRSNYNQSRKPANNTSDHELTDLDNAISFESSIGKFVPVRPQPRALSLNVQNRENISEQTDEGSSTSSAAATLHPYGHQMQNGLIPHSNHAAAAVMIVNPTTPNLGNISQPFNAPNQNRNNLTRNLNPARNNFEGNNHPSNNNTTREVSNSRTATKTVNLMNNMYDQGQGSSFNNLNDNSHIHRESARALGEAIVASCPDAAAVERRLGQIREYIRVTSSLVDTMRNSEDEQDVVVRPVSVQSNGSAYSESELWQNEIKNKMEVSQLRLAALKQQQRRLLKYQEEAKQQLDEMNRERHSQEVPPSTSHENFAGMQNQPFSGNYQHSNRMYAANQIGVATTLPHTSESLMQQNISGNVDSSHDRFTTRDANIASSEEAVEGGRDSEAEDDEGLLTERGQLLQAKLRELQLKKQHMENLVSEFQKLQMATRMSSSHNTYSIASSGEESGEDEPARKCNKTDTNIKNEDPFKLMEIKAIKTALQKTKDLMRSVENYETDHLTAAQEDFQIQSHSNIHDNKSDGGWSGEGAVCRVRNALPAHPLHAAAAHTAPRHKLTNEHNLHHHHNNHEANLASLQELAQGLRMETEKIMGEAARVKDLMSNKEASRKQKKVNEEVRATSRSTPGPVERRQMELRALLADKQRELEALLNKQKVMSSGPEAQKVKPDSRTGSVINQSYNSEQDEPDSRSEQILLDSQNSRENDNFRGGGDSGMGARSGNTIPSQLGSTYGSDSDSASRTKSSNQRNRVRRRQPQDRQSDDNSGVQSNNTNQNMRHEARVDQPNVNMAPPISQCGDNPVPMHYPHLPQPCWSNTKSNQDMRTNQFTQNSHSQTMERLLGTPQVSYPPSMPFNMMMPFGMVGGCGCGCGLWGAWCWQQLVLQQREIHQLREQLNHLEERWRAETASHTLNNQVPPGNRANNYWDNFRSYSRQNLLSGNSKTNAGGQTASVPPPPPHPLNARSHNALRRPLASTPPSSAPKRNCDAVGPTHPNDDAPNRTRRNLVYERSLSFSSAPDVLNVNQNNDDASAAPHSRNIDEAIIIPSININRQDTPNSFRNLNIANPIPEIIQSHSNNLNTSTKKKSSSKLPAKNSTNRRNCTLDYVQTSNINIASTVHAPNPNLASTSREVQDKATSKLFDLLRENVYSEVTALIDVNESHPDFLIQLFRELQLICSDPLRQKVLQSIRNVLSQYTSTIETQNNGNEENAADAITTTSLENNYNECNSLSSQSACTSTMQIDNSIVRFLLLKSDELCTVELLEELATQILTTSEGRRSQQSKKRILEILAKYEGMRVCDVSSDIIENLPMLMSSANENESTQLPNDMSEAILQDVAGSLNFSSSDPQLHQLNPCTYQYMWPEHVHVEIDPADINDNSPRSSHDGKVDLINCAEILNEDLAEADQKYDACEGGESHEGAGAVDALPDVVDTEEATPTEAEAEWFGLDRVPTRLHMEDTSEKQKD